MHAIRRRGSRAVALAVLLWATAGLGSEPVVLTCREAREGAERVLELELKNASRRPVFVLEGVGLPFARLVSRDAVEVFQLINPTDGGLPVLVPKPSERKLRPGERVVWRTRLVPLEIKDLWTAPHNAYLKGTFTIHCRAAWDYQPIHVDYYTAQKRIVEAAPVVVTLDAEPPPAAHGP
jgi:hypothetical protein